MKHTLKRKKPSPRRGKPAHPPANSGTLKKQLLDLLDGGHAHADWRSILSGIPEGQRGAKAPGVPHTPWQLLEHLRIAQWDILEFSRDANHVSPHFPAGYWPPSERPPNSADWDASVRTFEHDLGEMKRLVRDPKTDLLARIPHGNGQTVLREALVLADHNSYHLGQMVLLRRLLGAWPAS